jgi:hypothetical protein
VSAIMRRFYILSSFYIKTVHLQGVASEFLLRACSACRAARIVYHRANCFYIDHYYCKAGDGMLYSNDTVRQGGDGWGSATS